MKTMKKIVSVLLMACVLASILSVSAFAAFTQPAATMTAYAQGVTSSTAVSAVSNQNIDLSVALTDASGDLGGHTAQVYLNNAPYYANNGIVQKTTGDNGNVSFSLTPDKLLTALGKTAGFSQVQFTLSVRIIHRDGEAAGSTMTNPVSVTMNEYIAPSTMQVQATKVTLVGLNDDCGVEAILMPQGSRPAVYWDIRDDVGVNVVESSPDGNGLTLFAKNEGTVTVTAVSADNNAVSGFCTIAVQIPATDISVSSTYLELDLNDPNANSGTIKASVEPMQADFARDHMSWSSSNPAVATVDQSGVITAQDVGEADVVVSARNANNTTVTKTIKVKVKNTGASTPYVTITPAGTTMALGSEKQFRAETNINGYIEWTANPSGSVTITPTSSLGDIVIVKASQLTTSLYPVTLTARVRTSNSSYTEGTATINITQADALELQANPQRITTGNSSTVSVKNMMDGETFRWTYVLEPNVPDLASVHTYAGANYVTVTAGGNDGVVKIIAQSETNSNRKAEIYVYVNAAAPYGSGAVAPKSVYWTRGNGNLSFQVSPALYDAYLDNTYLNNLSSGYATYYNGVLTLKPALLNTLSSGAHTLKIRTIGGSNGLNPDGLVYATIYVNGTASNYGDSVHVKGSAYNLYFNATDPIREVRISGTYIDPANYSLDASRRQLTLPASFLNQLAYGNYTMTLTTDSGMTETATFRIVAANYAPATGDDNNILAWMAALAISGAGVIALIPRKKEQM